MAPRRSARRRRRAERAPRVRGRAAPPPRADGAVRGPRAPGGRRWLRGPGGRVRGGAEAAVPARGGGARRVLLPFSWGCGCPPVRSGEATASLTLLYAPRGEGCKAAAVKVVLPDGGSAPLPSSRRALEQVWANSVKARWFGFGLGLF